MTITYQATHSGIKLPTANTAIKRVPIEQRTCRGYFSRADLKLLLKPSDCVGIRIYNVDASSKFKRRRLIAVGLKKDGSGLGNYLLSNDSNSKTQEIPASSISKRIAVSIAEGGKPFDKTLFASYFSKDMIKELLHTDAEFDGIALYEVNMSLIEDEDLPIHMKGHVGTVSNTHIAVASNIKDGKIEHNPNPELHNVLSDTPCSSHCFLKGMTCEVREKIVMADALKRITGGWW